RERYDQPGRGIDAVGVRDDPLTLILGEVKTSDERRSPPRVVHKTPDSLLFTHEKHINNSAATSAKLWELYKRATDAAARDILARAALIFDEQICYAKPKCKTLNAMNLICYSLLVRSAGRFTK